MGTIFLELYTCGKYLRVNCTLYFSVYTVIKICVIKYLRNWFQQRKQWFRQIIFFFSIFSTISKRNSFTTFYKRISDSDLWDYFVHQNIQLGSS